MLVATNKISSMVIMTILFSECKSAREPPEIAAATRLLTDLPNPDHNSGVSVYRAISIKEEVKKTAKKPADR